MKKMLSAFAMVAIIVIASRFDIDLHNVTERGIMNGDLYAQKSEEFLVTRIIDGDTCEIDTGEKIRLIGIDTPERGENYYEEASQYLSQLILGKNIKIKKDVSEKDRYGRLLRHVYYEDQWINKKMIEEGYARLVTYPPDVMHVQVFREAEERSREYKKGLWSFDEEKYEKK